MAQESIRRILYAFITKFPSIGYCQGMNNIIIFLLCFNSEINAFKIFCFMVQNVLPKRFFEKTSKGAGFIGFKAETEAFT